MKKYKIYIFLTIYLISCLIGGSYYIKKFNKECNTNDTILLICPLPIGMAGLGQIISSLWVPVVALGDLST